MQSKVRPVVHFPHLSCCSLGVPEAVPSHVFSGGAFWDTVLLYLFLPYSC